MRNTSISVGGLTLYVIPRSLYNNVVLGSLVILAAVAVESARGLAVCIGMAHATHLVIPFSIVWLEGP